MLKYLVVLLDDTSVSYCHHENQKKERKLITLDDLRAGILFAMKQNLMIQFVYPDYELPQEYKDAIHSIDHANIVPASLTKDADVVVVDGLTDENPEEYQGASAVVFRVQKDELYANYKRLIPFLEKLERLNVVITDVEMFSDDDLQTYQALLSDLSEVVESEYTKGHAVQFNLLTDRMMLSAMNNCNAGDENITLAPDGKFYVCPAFYQAETTTTIENKAQSIGDLKSGLNVRNPQLYKLSHAPICRNCDAYQCKRCVWLNRKMTLEVNTPSHEQCIVAHTERNVSHNLLQNIRKHGVFMPEVEIKEIAYLDPFENKEEWQ